MRFAHILLLSIAIALIGCGSGSSSAPHGGPPGTTLSSITVSPSNPTVVVGGSQQFTAVGRFSDGSNQNLSDVTWSSSATNVATVNSSGLAAGMSPGTTSITARSGQVTGATTLSVGASNTRDDWITYGHDGRRTSSSLASINGPLNVLWRYDPQSPSFLRVYNALANVDGAFVQWSATYQPGFVGTTAVDRVSTGGATLWTWDSGTDTNLGNWGSIWEDQNQFVVNDDGYGFLDINSGQGCCTDGDSWGETLVDSSRVYLVNNDHVDGPNIYVGSTDSSGNLLWSQNDFGTCRIDVADKTAGLALNNGVLFYAANYSEGQGIQLPFGSGVYGFNAATGNQVAYQATQPTSRISADDQLVYLIESSNTLVARRQTDLSVAWSVTASGPGAQAPVLANGLVIIATFSRVEAYSATNGSQVWVSLPLDSASSPWNTTSFGGSCTNSVVPVASAYNGGPVRTTTMAAALGSGTLVVTTSDGIHILSLSNGNQVWSGGVAGAQGLVRDPIIVNDPSRGAIVYVVDSRGLIALSQ